MRSSYDEAMNFFAPWNGFLAGYPDWFTRIDDISDFTRAKKKVGVMLTFQNSTHFRSPDDGTSRTAATRRRSTPWQRRTSR